MTLEQQNINIELKSELYTLKVFLVITLNIYYSIVWCGGTAQENRLQPNVCPYVTHTYIPMELDSK